VGRRQAVPAQGFVLVVRNAETVLMQVTDPGPYPSVALLRRGQQQVGGDRVAAAFECGLWSG